MKKLRRPKSDSGKSKVLYPFILLTLAVLGYYALKAPPKAVVTQSLQAVKPLATAFTKAEDVKPEEKAAEEISLNKRRVVMLGQSQVGISSLKTSAKDGNIEVPFELKAQKLWCQAGDIDTIRYSNDNNFEKNIVISLESLKDNTRLAFIKVSTEDLYKGVKHSFNIRSFGAGDSLGLFICKSTDGKTSCKSKQLISHEKINGLVSNEETAKEARKNDYIYYFQSLVLGADSINTFAANDYLGKDKSALIKQLSAQFSLKEKDFEAAWRYSSVLNSLAARIDSGKILLTLPYNDPKCMDQSKAPG